jgi:hypothetical protein
VKQTCVIKEIVNNYFKKVNKQYNSFNELLSQMDLLKKEYIDKNKALSIKKETLWIKKDFSNFELNSIEPVDNSKIYIDREYALSKMCYKETDVLNKLYAKLGYFYYYNNEQFTHITETFDNEIQKVMKVFTTEIGATVTDTVQVYQEIASVQF